MNKEMTICYNCKHFYNKASSGKYKDMWYNHFCKAPDFYKKGEISPVTGKIEGDGYPYCRDLNRGECRCYQSSFFYRRSQGLKSASVFLKNNFVNRFDNIDLED